MEDALLSAIAAVPPGRWAVGVSGGADSVALLSILRRRDDVFPVVVHLDHQTRGQASTDDADFVRQLAERMGVPSVIERLEALEATAADLPTNVSARFRTLRFTLFQRVVKEHGLIGVLVAHHLDDQVETVFQRLLRGSGYTGLAGMRTRTRIGELLVLRPLLSIDRQQLRNYLREIGQTWREDASNASEAYQRNVVRMELAGDTALAGSLVELARACQSLREWTYAAAPVLPVEFAVGALADLPDVLARVSASRWLIDRGVLLEDIEPAVIDRLIVLCRDASSPNRQQFPGDVFVTRRRGIVSIWQPAPA